MNNNSAAKFQSLASRIKDADNKVDVMQGAGSVSAKELMEMKHFNGFGEAGAKLLAELADAEESTGKDPLVRYKWIEVQLATLSQQTYHDPEIALRVVSLCRLQTMPDKKTPARPFIVGFATSDEAQKYANEHVGKGIRPMPMPLVGFKGEGAEKRLSMHRVLHFVPNGPAERAAFAQIGTILKTTADSIMDILQNEHLFDLRLAVEWIVRTIPDAVLVHKGRLFDKESYARKGKDLYQPVPRGAFLRCFSLTREEQLLVPNTDKNRALIDHLHAIRTQNEWLANVGEDQVGIEISMLRELRAGALAVVTPQEFLKGHSGAVGVYRQWTIGSEKGHVYALFMRRDDGAWRVGLYNHAAAKMLLTSKDGVERRFTWYSGRKIPSHLENLLVTGKVIASAEDIGMSEDDFSEISGTMDSPAETQQEAQSAS